MDFSVRLAFSEHGAVRLLNFLARENALIFRADPELAGIYESGTVYRREPYEIWSDVTNMYLQGHEDCDALAAGRAGELLARGYRALNVLRGDFGALRALELRLPKIQAEVVLRTRTDVGSEGGLYHCIVRYVVDGEVYYDDPSARLGMYGFIDLRQPFITKKVLQTWEENPPDARKALWRPARIRRRTTA